MNLDLLINGQQYLFYMAAVMISVGVIKDNQYFADFIQLITTYIKSKRLAVALVSMAGGVLPIPGRVVVSAGLLDTMAPQGKTDHECHSRSKFGIVDYVSTHLYYLFSPLEKTIILPMAVLSLSYVEVLSYTLPLLAVSLAYIGWYIFFRLKEDDIVIKKNENSYIDWTRFVLGAVPIFVSIAALILGFSPEYVFSITAVYYLFMSSTYNIKKIASYVNWSLVGMLAVVIVIGNFTKSYDDAVQAWVSSAGLSMETISGFMIVSSVAFLASFAMGSSGKFAGMVALLASIYGLEYFLWFLAIEYAGYLISPAHKCTHIGRMYFGTTIREYYSVLLKWVGILVTTGFAGYYIS